MRRCEGVKGGREGISLESGSLGELETQQRSHWANPVHSPWCGRARVLCPSVTGVKASHTHVHSYM